MASRLTGAYLCEQRSYFSSTKYVLYIKTDAQSQSLSSESVPVISIILESTRNQSDRRVLPLRAVKSARPIQEGDETEKFSIITVADEELVLHSRERDRILTEIAIEKDRLPAEIQID